MAAQPRMMPRRFNLRTFESLKVRNYRYYFFSSLGHMASMSMQMVVNGWLVYRLTGSAALLGVTMLGNAVPTLLLSLFGGIIADRVPKKPVLILGLLASGLLSMGIALSISLDIITWHYLVANSVVQGAIFSLMMPSRMSIVSELVGREDLTNAVSLNAAAMNINQIGASAVAAFLLTIMGIDGVYYIAAVLYLFSAVLVLPIRHQPGSQASLAPPEEDVFQSIKNGLVYIRQNQALLAVLLLSLLTVLFSMPFRMLLPVFTEDIYKVGPDKLGYLISISGIGALAGSFITASMGNKGRGMLFLHTGIVTGVSILAFSVSTSYTLSLAIIAVTGLGQAGRMALGNALIQYYTEDAYMGRVMSLFMMQWGLVSLGTFFVSVAAEFAGVQLAVGATAVLLLLTTLYYYAFSPRIRRLD